jgi:hypothetical protein
MNQAPGSYGRWRAAENGGRDDDADGAFRMVFQTAIPEQPVSHDFTTRTMTAVAAAAAGDARRARRTRAGVLMGTVVATSAAVYFGAGWVVSLASAALIGLLNLVIAGAVRGASALTPGGVWPVLASLGRAAAALAADPIVTFAMIAISGVAVAALLALQRLLGSDGESFQ